MTIAGYFNLCVHALKSGMHWLAGQVLPVLRPVRSGAIDAALDAARKEAVRIGLQTTPSADLGAIARQLQGKYADVQLLCRDVAVAAREYVVQRLGKLKESGAAAAALGDCLARAKQIEQAPPDRLRRRIGRAVRAEAEAAEKMVRIAEFLAGPIDEHGLPWWAAPAGLGVVMVVMIVGRPCRTASSSASPIRGASARGCSRALR
jgi:hypothetical protein